MSTDANTLERIHQKFAGLCFNHFFPQVNYSYAYASEQLQLRTLGKRSYNYDATFHIQVYLDSKFHPPLLEAVGLLIKSVLLTDVLQLLMVLIWTLTYLEPKPFLLIIFHNFTS
jgi:hypothetical protein